MTDKKFMRFGDKLTTFCLADKVCSTDGNEDFIRRLKIVDKLGLFLSYPSSYITIKFHICQNQKLVYGIAEQQKNEN